jgi:methyl-accepting chemotaxis protein
MKMRINSILLGTHTLILAAGVVAGVLYTRFETPFVLCGCIVVSVAAWVAGYLVSKKIQADIAKLQRFADEQGMENLDSFFTEDCRVAVEKLKAAMEATLSISSSIRTDSREVKTLLTQLDRRGLQNRRNNHQTPVEQLRGLLLSFAFELDKEIKQIGSCGNEIKRGTESLGNTVETQRDMAAKLTNLLERFSAKSTTIQQESKSAIESAEWISDQAASGLSKCHLLNDELERIQDQIQVREKTLKLLNDRSLEIGTFVESISAISSRTDLLALNASIESVRAGEHGRGFAMVAEEVRSLAEQAAQSTRDISARIETIQNESRKALQMAINEHKKIRSTLENATVTAQLLKQILDSLKQFTVSNTQIESAVQQQFMITSETIETLENFSNASQAHRSQSENVKWTAATIGEVTQRLDESLETFRLLEFEVNEGRVPQRPERVQSQVEEFDGFSDVQLDENPSQTLVSPVLPSRKSPVGV